MCWLATWLTLAIRPVLQLKCLQGRCTNRGAVQQALESLPAKACR
jgi:hypothetical protein